jgi:DNA modification methylase
MLAIKNLAKYADEELKEVIMNIVRTDSSSLVRKEAVSAIGRMRSESCVEDLVTLLHDRDPSVVMQAIRGLLVFKKIDSVREQLIQIQNHPNEIIKEVIEIELLSGRKSSSKSHPAVDERLKNIVVNADVLQALEVIDSESIHLTFTSPPYYNAKDYSIYSSYQEYLDFLRSVFIETHRVTKEGRFLVVNTSPVIVSRFSRSHASKRYPIPFDLHTILVSMGWEFIDDIVWEKPEYSVKARNNGFLQHRKPLAYKPNSVTEMVIVYRKKTSKLIDWNLKQYPKEILEESKVSDGYETSNLWEINPSNDSVHTAVFPNELCDKIIQYYSLVGDLVFDPFGGAGTLGLSAVRNKRNFFLTEIDEDYVNRMKVRFSKLKQPKSKVQIIEPGFLSLDEFKKSYEN